MEILWLTHHKVIQLKLPKRLFFPPKTYPSQRKGKSMALQLLKDSLELAYLMSKVQSLSTYLWPCRPLPQAVLLSSKWRVFSPLVFTKSFKHVLEALHRECIVKEDGKVTTLAYTNQSAGTEYCSMKQSHRVLSYNVVTSACSKKPSEIVIPLAA